MSQDALTRYARGQDCQIRLSVCNGNSETVVPCHFRLGGISGIGFKPPSFMIAFGCSSCHAVVDSITDDATQLAFAQAVFRTQVLLHKAGLIRLGRNG